MVTAGTMQKGSSSSLYRNKGLPENPFAVLDQDGVGKLVETGVKLGRKTKPKLKTGICGEHGGEKTSIEFCYNTGLDYVSCSPYRVPLARLAAAQATIRKELNISDRNCNYKNNRLNRNCL